ncbi:7725_t:CDS:2, partial [Ambispora leptoticha]
QIIGDPTFDRATLCVVERNYPSREDYLKNPNSEAKDVIYHQDCYKQKYFIINDVNDLRKMARKMAKKVAVADALINFPRKSSLNYENNFKIFPKKEQDAFLMAQLINTEEGETTTKTYFNMLGISLKYFESVKDHFLSEEKVKEFLEKYAQKHGQPDPSQKYARKIAVDVRSSGEVVFLPTEMSYKSVHDDFVISFEKDNKLKSLNQDYFVTRYKVHLAGVHNEATKEQINYVNGENELLNKGPNGILSIVLNGIKQFNRGEKHLKINCDNSAGQNKNKDYYETIEQNFMLKGHNKSKVDGSFGMIKRRYKKSTVYSIEQFAEVVKKSSPTGYNKVQCYKDGKGFQYYDIRESLEPYFTKLPNIGKYHHFLIENSNLGVVKVKELVDSP